MQKSKIEIKDKLWSELTAIEKIKIEFEENSMLRKFYLWLFKKNKEANK